MIGYEWTSVPGGNNLHRNILFRDNKDKASHVMPFSVWQSEGPEKLWEWMAKYEEKTGGKLLAIPHDANFSNGRMFEPVTHAGAPLSKDYAERRARFEVLQEMMQTIGGWDFTVEDTAATDLPAVGYAKGVPMGGMMPKATADAKAPSSLVVAMKDPQSGNLDRIQIVKGWTDRDNNAHEKIYNVTWSDAPSRKLDANGELSPVGDTVDVATATCKDTSGAPQLTGVWTNPEFNPTDRAFYYARAIENPTPRWTAYDAVRFGIKMPREVPMKHQERAWTSSIWYTPD